jgi:carbamate kinase
MLRSEARRGEIPALSLDVAGAMSQGQIGYLLQQEIGSYLQKHGDQTQVSTLLTQVVVEPDDPGFRNPSKPIGRFYSREAAARLRRRLGWTLAEDAGRGYRRLVPSPQPKAIVEWRAIEALARSGVLVIAGGGGGIPVVKDRYGRLQGVEAVIDKDLAAQLLASLVSACDLIMLTQVDAVALDFGTALQRQMGITVVDDLEAYQAQGQFPLGSMGPKVQAAIQFVRAGGERAIITSPKNLVAAVYDRSVGTQIVSGSPSDVVARGSAAS